MSSNSPSSWRISRVLVIAALCVWSSLFLSCSDPVELDPRLVGSWRANLGQLALRFEVEGDGRYRTEFVGPFAPPMETGQLVARDGTWQLHKDSGEAQGGSYRFLESGAVLFRGPTGDLTWHPARGEVSGRPVATPVPAPASPGAMPEGRQAQAIPSLPGAGVPPSAVPTPIRPMRSAWPLSGLPEIAQAGLARAREWHGDAVLTGIETQLLQSSSPVVNNVETPSGRATLTLTFCSPGAHRSLLLQPVRDGMRQLAERSAECVPEQAIPATFSDLPEAIRQARERGMRAAKPSRARLTNRIDGVSGEGASGVSWHVFSSDPSDKKLSIPAMEPAVATVRAVDPCRLVTRTEAEQILGGEVRLVPPHYQVPQTWTCHYRLQGSRDHSLTLFVDESPARDARGFMENQRRNRRLAVADLGDEAYLFNSSAGTASLDVRVGETLLQFSLFGPGKTRPEILEKVARQSLERLAAGDGVLADTSPDAKLVGDWVTDRQDWRLLLSVQPDKALTLTVARPEQRVIDAAGGNWRILDRARREVRSGSFTWLGSDRFRTSGGMDAEWTRQHDADVDKSFPASLTDGSGIQASSSLFSGPWPALAVEPGFVGLWRGEGRVDRVDVEMLWRIRETGPSTLVTFASGKGYVSHVDRWQRVILRFSEGLERIGRQLQLGFHNGAVVTGFPTDDRMTMQMHNLSGVEWRRVGATDTPDVISHDTAKAARPGPAATPPGMASRADPPVPVAAPGLFSQGPAARFQPGQMMMPAGTAGQLPAPPVPGLDAGGSGLPKSRVAPPADVPRDVAGAVVGIPQMPIESIPAVPTPMSPTPGGGHNGMASGEVPDVEIRAPYFTSSQAPMPRSSAPAAPVAPAPVVPPPRFAKPAAASSGAAKPPPKKTASGDKPGDEPSAVEEAGRQAVEAVGEAADAVGDFFQGIFDKRSSDSSYEDLPPTD